MVLLWSIADLLSLNRRDLLLCPLTLAYVVPPCSVKEDSKLHVRRVHDFGESADGMM